MSTRRKFTAKFKARVVLEVLSGAKTPAQACREYRIRDSLLYKWRREFLEQAHIVFEKNTGRRTGDEARIAELERMVGRLTMELEAGNTWQHLSLPRTGNGRSPTC